jgi:hypothetical protein
MSKKAYHIHKIHESKKIVKAKEGRPSSLFQLHKNLVQVEKRGLGSPNITPIEFFFPPYHKQTYGKINK